VLLGNHALCRAALGFAQRADVQIQLSKGSRKRVPVDSQYTSGFSLVPVQVSQDGQHELFPEFSDRVRKRDAVLLHLAHQRIELGAGGI
jgi:hypothetical protein